MRTDTGGRYATCSGIGCLACYVEHDDILVFRQGVRLIGLTDQQRDRIRQHSKYCLSCARLINFPEKLGMTEIARTAKDTQERMGLSQQDWAEK